MRQVNVQSFTDTEEKFTNLLIEIGVRKNVATVLVFLMNIPESPSRAMDGTVYASPK